MKKRVVFLLSLLLVLTITTISDAKYVIQYTNTVANIKIDLTPPQIKLFSTRNSNSLFPKYANRTHDITIEIKVVENNIYENHFDKENVKILVGENEVIPKNFEIEKCIDTGKIILYQVKLNQVLGDGKLRIKVKEGTIKNISDQVNEETIIDTGIKIDNTSPIIGFTQQEKENKKVIANLKANEAIRDVNGWTLTQDRRILSKEFESNVYYPLKVMDLAQNTAQIDIDITKATYFNIKYGALNQKTKWSFGDGNHKVAGEETILENGIETTEMFSLLLEGEIEKDFIQVQNYIHTYWGEGKHAISYTYETDYCHGYNPSENTYVSFANGDKAYVNGKISLIMGGDGVNRANSKGIGGKAIPEEIAKQYLFGISGLKMKLKEETNYSIVYQIWVKNQGWQKAVSDGEEAVYSHDKPMGGYRMAVIPKTEKQYIIDFWNEDIGTNNVK